MTNYRKIITALVAVIALGGATVVSTAPAEAQTNYRSARVNGI